MSPSEVEVEWQLDALDLRPVERWLSMRTGPAAMVESLPGLAVLPGAPKRLVDVYVDTQDWRLGRAGYVLRVRRRAGQVETTLKELATATKGLRRRLEVTQPLPASGLAGLDRNGDVGWRTSTRWSGNARSDRFWRCAQEDGPSTSRSMGRRSVS